jgi:hypothetical protein
MSSQCTEKRNPILGKRTRNFTNNRSVKKAFEVEEMAITPEVAARRSDEAQKHSGSSACSASPP